MIRPPRELLLLLASWRRHMAAQRMSEATLATYSAAVGQLDDFLEISLVTGDTVGLLFHAHTLGTGCGDCTGPGCSGSALVPAQGIAHVVVHGDVEPPVVTSAPRVAGAVSSTLGRGSTMVIWDANDAGGAGIDRYELQQQKDGGSWTTIAWPTRASAILALALGHSYRHRVRAHDRAGNVGAWSVGAAVVPRIVQGSSSLVSPRGSWRTQFTALASGGSTRWNTSTRARATFRFTGYEVAWVGSLGPGGGRVDVFVDGVLYARVDLHARAIHWRRVLFNADWVSRGTHTIELRSSRASQRVDVDAFVVYK